MQLKIDGKAVFVVIQLITKGGIVVKFGYEIKNVSLKPHFDLKSVEKLEKD